jgi:RES domain-containing protein
LSDHPAATLVETLVHLEIDPEDLPDTYQLLAVEIPDEIQVESIKEDRLAPGWRRDVAVTRALGDQWLREGRTALLQVPSAIVPFAWNWLLNPAHADGASARVVDIIQTPFDPRLFRAP